MPAREIKRTTCLDEQNNDRAMLDRAAEQLNDNSCFRRLRSQLDFSMRGGQLVIAGQLPSFYLKQLLQETLRELPVGIINQVEVVYRIQSRETQAAQDN